MPSNFYSVFLGQENFGNLNVHLNLGVDYSLAGSEIAPPQPADIGPDIGPDTGEENEMEIETDSKSKSETDIDTYVPPKPQFTLQDTKHLLFEQWHQMIQSATNPTHKLYPLVGGRNIYVMERWFSFSNFKADMFPRYEINPALPWLHRKSFLIRIDKAKGFNPSNCRWGTRSEYAELQKKTVLVNTIFGRCMTLKDVERTLREKSGELFPDGRVYTLRVQRPNALGKLETVNKLVDRVEPVKMAELRKRIKKFGTEDDYELLRPTRPYGVSTEIQDKEAMEELDNARKERQELIRRQIEAMKEDPNADMFQLAALRAELNPNRKPDEDEDDDDIVVPY